ncbi:ribosome silencing factor [Singulisphaera rosea]
MAEPNESTEVTPTSEAPVSAKTQRRRSRHALHQDDVPYGASGRIQPDRLARALEHATICARIADDNRAKDILLLDLREVTPLVDYFMIATAASRRQAHAIASEIDQEMKKLGEHKLGIEGSEEGRWILIDYGDFVVHVFSGEARTYYALEEIWGDAARLEWQDPTRQKVTAPAPDVDEAPESSD